MLKQVFIPDDHFALSLCAKDCVPDDSMKNWDAFPSMKNIRVPGLVTNRKKKKVIQHSFLELLEWEVLENKETSKTQNHCSWTWRHKHFMMSKAFPLDLDLAMLPFPPRNESTAPVVEVTQPSPVVSQAWWLCPRCPSTAPATASFCRWHRDVVGKEVK